MQRRALYNLHFIVFLWGFTAILGKLIHAPANVLVFYRMAMAAGFLFLYLKFIKKQSLKISRGMFLQLGAIGVAMAAHWFCFFTSIKVSNVSIALSCLSLGSLFAAFLEPLVFRRTIDWTEVLIGIVIVGCMSTIFQTELKYREGIFYGIVCAVFGTIFSVFNGKIFGKTSSGNIIFYEIASGAAALFIFYIVNGEVAELRYLTGRDVGLIILLASVFTAYPMLQSVKLMKYISPFTLILTVNLEPVYGIVLAFFIFDESERMSSVFYLATLIMLVAIVANGMIKSRKKALAADENISL